MSGCGTEQGLISVDQALDFILHETKALKTEQLMLNQALHRYLAAAVYCQVDLPIFAQSAVDGYAICAQSVIEADTKFELVGEIRAGQQAAMSLQAGQAVRIFTGAPIPVETTTVARQEIVHLSNSAQIQIKKNLSPNVDIRHAGEEITRGQLLAEQGQYLTVGAIASLSMAGVKTVEVVRYPKVAVVITGDEVADTVEDLASGKIFDANAPLIRAWFQQAGQSVDILHVEDSAAAVKALLQRLVDPYDLIFTTGGISVGDYDFIRPAALDSGFQQIFWKVKQKPGKPIFFARKRRDDDSHCYLLGLPGNPAAVYVGMQVYASTLLLALQGQQRQLNWITAILTHDLKPDERERFLRMSVTVDQATLKVTSLSKQQSHMLSNLMQANALVRIPPTTAMHAGQIVKVLVIQG